MFINSVLQKYPNTRRPEALFDITNISSSCFDIEDVYSSLKSKVFDIVCKVSSRPSFAWNWYEYSDNYLPEQIRIGIVCSCVESEDCCLVLYLFIKQKDQPLPIFFGSAFFKMKDNYIFDYDQSVEFSFSKGFSVEDPRDITYFYQSIMPVLYTNALLSCKNVSTDSHEFTNRRSIQHYKRIDKPYFEKYYTLKLEVPGSKKQGKTEDDVESDGYTRAFHICRGHFKIYTEANPLFGKYTGTYWWNSQARGDIEAGIIDKDYSLKTGCDYDKVSPSP